MNKREGLKMAVRAMFILLILAFAYVLFSSLNGGVDQRVDSSRDFSGLGIGQTTIKQFKGQRVWVTRLSGTQRAQTDSLASYVHNPAVGCGPQQEYCVLVAATKRSGIELRFTENTPAQINSDTPWFGGFVNPVTGACYDLLGRTYKLFEGPESLRIIPSK